MKNERTVLVEDESLRSGFTLIPNQILRRADITTGAKLTYMVLLSYAWTEDSCFPGQERMAEDMGVSERSVITYLQQLQKAKLITIKRRGQGETNLYIIHRLARSADSSPLQVKKSNPLEAHNFHPKKTQFNNSVSKQKTKRTNDDPMRFVTGSGGANLPNVDLD